MNDIPEMNELRPIGTEFEIIYPAKVGMCENQPLRDRRVKYIVVGHVKAQRYPGDQEGRMMEELRLISITYEDADINAFYNYTGLTE